MKKFLIVFWGLSLAPLAFAAETASLTWQNGRLVWQHITPDPRNGAAQVVAGPKPGVEGFAEQSGSLIGQLPVALSERGGVMFWFQTDRAYLTGRDARRVEVPLVEIDRLVKISFVQQKGEVMLFVKWDPSVDRANERHIRVLLPELPGPDWHHFSVFWDAEKGLLNALLNGTPFYFEGQTIPAWKNLSGDKVTIHAEKFALADIRIGPEPLTTVEIARIVGPGYVGKLDRLVGAGDLGSLDAESRRGELIYQNALADPAAVRDWKLEGPGLVTFDDWGMTMASERPSGPEGHFVFWCPEKFPGDFVAEWEFELLSDDGLCIVFFAAQGLDGKDMFDPSLPPRDGVFGRYVNGEIACYHISYYADSPLSPRRTTNLRKNPGLNLASSGPAGVAPLSRQTHKVALVKDGSRITLSVDGKVSIDFTDDGERFGTVLGEGRIGFRQMQWTKGRYRNFRVHHLKPNPAPL